MSANIKNEKSFDIESLIESIGKANIDGKKFLLPRASVAREILPDALRKMGANIDVVPVYQTVAPKNFDSSFIKRLDEGSIDVITFTSSSTVTNFLDMLGKEHHDKLHGITVACIGPITRKTAGTGTSRNTGTATSRIINHPS